MIEPSKAWRKKQKLAAPSRYYGNGGTLHDAGALDIEVVDGRVVSVWFRCQPLPFRQIDLAEPRASLSEAPELPELTGVEVLDPEPRDAAVLCRNFTF
jgi:hypothetical protein